MHAVPRFDLQPGERLVPVREIHSEIGALIKQQATDQLLDASAPHLRVSEVSKTYYLHRGSWLNTESREFLAVDRVSLEVERGECFGLVGESGCGKTTLSKIIMRAITPDQGDIIYTTATARSTCVRWIIPHCSNSGARCSSSSRTRSARSIRG